MRRVEWWIVAVLAAFLMGCSGDASKGPAPPSPAAAKAALADLATHGKMGSGLLPVNTYLDSLKKTDAAKAETLAKEVQGLGKLSGKPDALKAKAKEIADKL